MVAFNNFDFQYRSQADKTLRSINLTIYEGEKVLIVGPSGSGKSTLANCINGLIPFSYRGEIKGSLKIAGKETSEESIAAISRTVGTVMQDTDGQFIGLSAGEDIAFALENDCVGQVEMIDRVFEAAKLTGVENHLLNAPHELSGGQKQRVCLAGVMVDNVSVLLFDEPLASLDPATGKRAISLIDELHQKTGVTTIIIEHRLEDVLHCGLDRIVVVSDGGIVCDMRPDELLSSNILKDCGLREPLYITALKYAGCAVEPEMKPADLANIELSACAGALRDFAQKTAAPVHSASEEVILELRDICFSYSPGRPVLQNISLAVKKGEMLSIIGRNGAGKSTLSRLICGFITPGSGTILYKGRDISGDTIKERAASIGMVMQNPNEMISKNMISDEVALGLTVRGTDAKTVREKTESVLKICGLYPFRSWPVSALSYGQKKRVTIASILALDPEVLILDEPTAGQDYKHYTEIMEFIYELNKSGVTIIIITHDMHLMLEYARRAVVLSDGQLIHDGSSVTALTDQYIIEKANLKETSLFTIANKAGVEAPEDFVWKFINYDRETVRHAGQSEQVRSNA